MEVAIESNGSPPFQREVREWQRVDPNTGALLTGRLEADRWITGPQNAYGKVVDSQNMSQPNGIKQTQRKQLEVLHARTSSGSLQVVRAQSQTVQSSSTRWSSSSLGTGTKTTQSLAGQRFSIPLQMITSQNHCNVSHGPPVIAEPSSKLSSLMKNSAAPSNSSSRSSPRSPSIFESTGTTQPDYYNVILPSSAKAFDRSDESSSQKHNYTMHVMDKSLNETDIAQSSDNIQRLHRGRSISNDDLASSDHWDHHRDKENGEDFLEWRRVSKIRRSFQIPKSSSPPKLNPCWPLDLPENTVSVSRIRQELENGRRLNTVMRNNHVDLVALDNILNCNPPITETDDKLSKETAFLTAESLKKIRGKLKKINNETLYREDFVVHDASRADTDTFCMSRPHDMAFETSTDSKIVHHQSPQSKTKVENSYHNTNSLENKTRHRDTTSSEWYLRRKSYGFENMIPPPTSMFRQETSRDSGIGQSSELANWSPTENTPRATVITFGNDDSSSPQTSITLMNSSGGVVQRYKQMYDPKNEVSQIKRHSIAVDESKYVRDSKSSVNLNGFYMKEIDSTQASIYDDNARRQKRVEFCKTEVHFAAESGRVNIVETDGKPPSTNKFRRRRQSSVGSVTNAYLEAINSGKPIIHFGDDFKTQIEQNSQHIAVEESNHVTVITNGKPDLVLPFTVQEDNSEAPSDEISIRGILKNKPVKPKPYHLGENVDNTESLWGIRLRSVSAELSTSKSEDKSGGKLDMLSVNNSSSVAERVRIVEERKDGAGYSTKINFNLSNSQQPCDTSDLPSVSPYSNDRRKSTHFEILSECLKSTSLIMQTIRLQSCCDESSFRIRIPECLNKSVHRESSENRPEADITMREIAHDSDKQFSESHSVSTSNNVNNVSLKSVTKGNLDENMRRNSLVTNDELTSSKIVSSSSFSSTSTSSFQYEQAMVSDEAGIQILKTNTQSSISNEKRKPIAAPRIKVIGSTNTVNHQLSQLRRMYDAAEADSDDDSNFKADEEVKLYLGYRNAIVSSEETTSELSGSWSRIKAKRCSVKRQSKNDFQELPKSNVMTIELHSPTTSLQRDISDYAATSSQKARMLKTRRSAVKTNEAARRVSGTTTVEKKDSFRQNDVTDEKPRGSPLKIETGGARRLKDHELLYFGVKLSTPKSQIQQVNACDNNLEEANRTALVETKAESVSTVSQTWKLSSDKPDLLRHSPVTTFDSKNVTTEEVLHPVENKGQGPVYENLQKPSLYNRKRDRERAKTTLREINIEIEQALKPVTSEKSSRDQQRQSSEPAIKPLQTINENRSSIHSKEKITSSDHDAQTHEQNCSNQPLPISSKDSLVGLKAAQKNHDYVNMQKTHREECLQQKDRHGSNSHHHQRTTAKSTEDVHNGIGYRSRSSNSTEPLRRSRNSKTSTSGRSKEKERVVVKVDENQQITKSTVRMTENLRNSNSPKVSKDLIEKPESIRSTKNDKCDTSRSKVSSTRSSNDSRKMSRSKPTSGVKPSSTSSSSKRSSRSSTRK